MPSSAATQPGTAAFRAWDSSAATSPYVSQKPRIDAAGQIAELLKGVGRLGLELCEQLLGLRRIALSDLLGEAELHRERDQLLLRSVVDVSFDLAAFLVLSGHQSLA